jgi:hypothetical protein
VPERLNDVAEFRRWGRGLLGHTPVLSGLPAGFWAVAAEDTLCHRIPARVARPVPGEDERAVVVTPAPSLPTTGARCAGLPAEFR